MEQTILNTNKQLYFNSREHHAVYAFCHALRKMILANCKPNQDIILLCIGSDRATGDCLGPLIGYKLSKSSPSGFSIYGTLKSPVHAKNLKQTLSLIPEEHPHPFIIAIDASLGISSHIGYVTLAKGPLSPGIGVDKALPPVGDIHITGIVNLSGILSHALLQTTRLEQVMNLADFICVGMRYATTKPFF